MPSEDGHNLTETCKGIHIYIFVSHWTVWSNHSTIFLYLFQDYTYDPSSRTSHFSLSVSLRVPSPALLSRMIVTELRTNRRRGRSKVRNRKNSNMTKLIHVSCFTLMMQSRRC
jgi:hypothetical protein